MSTYLNKTSKLRRENSKTISGKSVHKPALESHSYAYKIEDLWKACCKFRRKILAIIKHGWNLSADYRFRVHLKICALFMYCKTNTLSSV